MVTDPDHGSTFYRDWSSRAARQALDARQTITKDRCSLSASVWCSIADAIEAGDAPRVASLTHNLTFISTRYLAPSC